MTTPNPHDRQILQDVDRVLAQGQPSEMEIINMLARHIPQPPHDFEHRLEADLLHALAQPLPPKTIQWRWLLLAAVILMVIGLGALFAMQQRDDLPAVTILDQTEVSEVAVYLTPTLHSTTTPSPTPTLLPSVTITASPTATYTITTTPTNTASVTPSITPTLTPMPTLLPGEIISGSTALPAESVPVVVAVQHIPKGMLITAEMLTVIHVPAFTVAAWQPAGVTVYNQINSVINQPAYTHLRPLQPVTSLDLGQVQNLDTYAEILSAEPTVWDGLFPGDFVDVLTIIDGQVVVLVEDVYLQATDADKQEITFRAVPWKRDVLQWLDAEGLNFMLRLNSQIDSQLPVIDTESTTLTFGEFPDDNLYDIVIGVAFADAHHLTAAPYSLDYISYLDDSRRIQIGGTEDVLKFLFRVEAYELVTRDDTTYAEITLPETQAALFSFLQAHATTVVLIPRSQ